jgi:iron complex outermembrane receptor protein
MRLTFAYGYLDPEYDEFIVNGVDLKDTQKFQFTPENTASIAADIALGTFDWGALDLHVDWSYKDDQYPFTNPVDAEKTQVDAYDVLNARLTLSEVSVGGSQLKLSVWGKNLLDEEYTTSGIPFPGWGVDYYGDPRTYGIDATFEF